MRRVLVFHRDHCLACRSCELACSVAHSESGELEAAIAEECPPVRRVVVAQGPRDPMPLGIPEELRKDAPASGRGKLKHAPPMQANDLPVVAQAVSPANRICSQLLTEGAVAGYGAAWSPAIVSEVSGRTFR